MILDTDINKYNHGGVNWCILVISIIIFIGVVWFAYDVGYNRGLNKKLKKKD